MPQTHLDAEERRSAWIIPNRLEVCSTLEGVSTGPNRLELVRAPVATGASGRRPINDEPLLLLLLLLLLRRPSTASTRSREAAGELIAVAVATDLASAGRPVAA